MCAGFSVTSVCSYQGAVYPQNCDNPSISACWQANCQATCGTCPSPPPPPPQPPLELGSGELGSGELGSGEPGSGASGSTDGDWIDHGLSSLSARVESTLGNEAMIDRRLSSLSAHMDEWPRDPPSRLHTMQDTAGSLKNVQRNARGGEGAPTSAEQSSTWNEANLQSCDLSQVAKGAATVTNGAGVCSPLGGADNNVDSTTGTGLDEFENGLGAYYSIRYNVSAVTGDTIQAVSVLGRSENSYNAEAYSKVLGRFAIYLGSVRARARCSAFHRAIYAERDPYAHGYLRDRARPLAHMAHAVWHVGSRPLLARSAPSTKTWTARYCAPRTARVPPPRAGQRRSIASSRRRGRL